jgi:hypothetical protein
VRVGAHLLPAGVDQWKMLPVPLLSPNRADYSGRHVAHQQAASSTIPEVKLSSCHLIRQPSCQRIRSVVGWPATLFAPISPNSNGDVMQ